MTTAAYNPIGKATFWHHRVYFGDTDAAQVVYHARYVHWMEAGRIEYLEALGCPYTDFQAEKMGFVPIDVHVRYFKPLVFGDYFSVETKMVALTQSTFTVKTRFLKNDTTMAEAEVVLAALNEEKWKPTRVPRRLIEALMRFEANV
ncbi:MAG: acyl-CoA thioesterase [Candidatus Margulisiibacteriota bacterium]